MPADKLPTIEEILKLLPHRYPFLLVDRLLDFQLQKSITGVKSITYNEWYFQGLPPELMIVPASILSEAIAQLGAMLILLEEESRGKLIFFSGLDRVRFRKPVRPGDSLIMSANILRRRGRVGRLQVEARVNEILVFEGIMKFAMEADAPAAATPQKQRE